MTSVLQNVSKTREDSRVTPGKGLPEDILNLVEIGE